MLPLQLWTGKAHWVEVKSKSFPKGAQEAGMKPLSSPLAGERREIAVTSSGIQPDLQNVPAVCPPDSVDSES